MTTDSVFIDKSGYSGNAVGLHAVPRSGEYAGLVRRLFRSHSALAVIGIGQKSRAAEAVRGIAAELGACGNRVVIVTPEGLLRTDPPAVGSGYRVGGFPNVWLWPDASDGSLDTGPELGESPTEVDRIAYLCREFDFVLLDCPAIDTSPSAPDIAAMADATVLVVEAAQTARNRVEDAQRMLELRGVRLAGCILLQRR